MNVLFTIRRRAAARLLVLATVVVLLAGALLVGAQGTGQAATTSAPPKPKDVDAFAVTVLKSTGTYWGQVLTQLGHPAWHSYYFIVKRDKIVRTPCGLAGDRDLYPGAGWLLPLK